MLLCLALTLDLSVDLPLCVFLSHTTRSPCRSTPSVSVSLTQGISLLFSVSLPLSLSLSLHQRGKDGGRLTAMRELSTQFLTSNPNHLTQSGIKCRRNRQHTAILIKLTDAIFYDNNNNIFFFKDKVGSLFKQHFFCHTSRQQ